MADDRNYGFPGADPFSAFWMDFMKKVGPVGVTPPQLSPDTVAQMRQAFFDVLAEHADRFMRSEVFLSMMKQTMDNALAWQQAMNQFLQKGVTASQVASREDADHMALLVRGMEERLERKLDQIGERLEQVERGGAGKAPAEKPHRPAGSRSER